MSPQPTDKSLEPTGRRKPRLLAPLLPALLVLAAVAVTAPAASTPPLDNVVYQTDFSGLGADPAWGANALSGATAPSGERFMGRFTNGQVRLVVEDAVPHSRLTISFDLYIIETWDGQGGPYQSTPDEWRFVGPNGEVLVDTSFSNCDRESQDYPWPLGLGGFSAATGAQATDSLGYPLVCYFWEGVGDSTYHFQFTVNHALPAATFSFEGIGLQTPDDESWGLDNVRVTAA